MTVTAPPSLSKQDKLRVLAMSSAVAGGVLTLFLIDYVRFGWFDSSFLFMLIATGSIEGYQKARTSAIFLCCLLAGAWALTALQAWRHGGRGGTAAVGVGILIAGLVLIVLLQVAIRNGWFGVAE